MKSSYWILAVLVLLVVWQTAEAQQDRATLTGIVTDSTGAVVPTVKVEVRNAATNAVYNSETNALGRYVIPNLPVASYKLTFESPGFRTYVREGVTLAVGQVARIDVQLEVGPTAESVEVTAEAPLLQTESPEVGAVLDNRKVTDLPLSFSGGRSPEMFAYLLSPGVEGDPWESRINGSYTFTKEVLLDGASTTTYLAGDFGQASPSLEALEEFKVQTSGMSAEYGRTGGGIFNFVMKSGTNDWHGTAMALFRNESLNANTFSDNYYGNPRRRDRKHNWAVSGGGPVIFPKVYNGKDKTFFYVTYEKYDETFKGQGPPTLTVPLPEWWDGDMSRYLTNEVVGQDALGRDIIRGTIYDPTTSREVDGKIVRDPFYGNIIPKSMISGVSSRLGEIFKQHYLPQVRQPDGQFALTRNLFAAGSNQQFMRKTQFSFKVDQNISDKHKVNGMVSYNNRPRLLTDNKGGNNVWSDTAEEGGPLSAAENNPFTNYMGRINYDYMASATLLNHFVAAVNHSKSHHRAAHLGEGGPEILGLTGEGIDPSGAWPNINFTSGDRVQLADVGFDQINLQYGTSYQISDTISWFKGKHMIKAGVDARLNRFNTIKVLNSGGSFSFDPQATGLIGNSYVGHSFASMLLGEVNSGSGRTSQETGSQFWYLSAFVNDDIKVTPRFTLTLGLRWDYQPVQTEMYDRLYSFCTTCPDPGTTGYPGALIYSGEGEGRTGERGFVDNRYNGWGPRIGLAYQITNKFVFRAGYGIFYVPRAPNDWAGVPYGSQIGFAGSNVINRERAGFGTFNWDDGYPGKFKPGTLDPSAAQSQWGPVYWHPGGGVNPYIQQWNANFEYELPNQIVLDAGYLGSKGTKIWANQLYQFNQLSTEAVQTFGDDLQDVWFNRSDWIPDEAVAMGAVYPFPERTKWISLQQSLQPFPQIPDWSEFLSWNVPDGFSTYHSMQVSLTKRYSSGLSWLANYTFSKNITNLDTAFNTWVNLGRPMDYYNLGLEKSISPYDRTHIVKGSFSYELPFGRGKRFGGDVSKPLDILIGGWTIQYIGTYYSGTPLSFPGKGTPNSNFAANRAIINNPGGASLYAGFDPDRFDMSLVSTPNSQHHGYVNTSLISDPVPYERGNAPYANSQIRGFGQYNEDFGLQKNIMLTEEVRFQLRGELLNAFNRHNFSSIATSPSDPLFGQVTGVNDQHRVIQVGMRLDF